MTDLQPIQTEALREIERLWGARPGTPDGILLDTLVDIVEVYEQEKWPIAQRDPLDAIRGHMEWNGYTQADLAELLGSRSRASEILSRKRALTVEMIHKLSREWGLPAELLVRPYKKGAA